MWFRFQRTSVHCALLCRLQLASLPPSWTTSLPNSGIGFSASSTPSPAASRWIKSAPRSAQVPPRRSCRSTSRFDREAPMCQEDRRQESIRHRRCYSFSTICPCLESYCFAPDSCGFPCSES